MACQHDRPKVIVIDLPAVIAIFMREPDADRMLEVMRRAHRPRLSAANLLEVLMVLDGRTASSNRDLLEGWLTRLDAEIEPVTAAQAWLAHEAFRRFGKGIHPARLNYGDCFAYGLARELDMPLLFKGNDFPLTDIRPALEAAA